MTQRIEFERDPHSVVSDLRDHCQQLFRSLTRSDQRRASEAYVRGLLHCEGKKSIRRIAMESAHGPSDQSLQQFVNQSSWDPVPVRRHLADWASAREQPLAWVVGEVAFPKHGTQSAGVERQYVKSRGRLSNCQIGVYAALAFPSGALPVSWRLTLPKSWDDDALRRRKARIPPEERHRPQWQYGIAALDDLCGDWGVPLAPVVFDLRDCAAVPDAVAALEERGLEFLAEVDRNLPVRSGAAGPSPSMHAASLHRDARRPTVEGTLADRSPALAELPRRTLSWREPASGREVRAQFSGAQVRVGPAGPPLTLLLEWGLGKQTPRAYWLTNLRERELDELVALSRHAGVTGSHIDLMSTELGLCDYEGRSFLGWHHHVTLVSAAHAFRMAESAPGEFAENLTESASGLRTGQTFMVHPGPG